MTFMVDRYKRALRQTYLQIRPKLPTSYQRNISHQVCTHIRRLEHYRYAKKIALYHAMNGEIDLSSIWKSAPLQGRYCYFPALNEDNTLLFLPATPATSFYKNRFGIDEPDVDRKQAIMPQDLDLIFLPLVAFDKLGTRVGMGAGYYDRTLTESHSSLYVGVAYEFQRLPFIEANQWDISLDVIITERGPYWKKTVTP